MSESFAGITVPEGEPGELRSAAHAFEGAADALNATGAQLEGMPGMLTSWQGPASVIYADSCITNGAAAQNAVWACQIAAQAVLGYALALHDAKHEAREAIRDARDATRRIKDAEDRIETAQAQIAEATFSLDAAETDILVTGATGAPSPDALARRDSAIATIDGAAADERAARRDLEQARDDLERAKRRGERAEQDAKDAARTAAGAVSVAGGLAPAPMPPPPPPAAPKEEEKDKPWYQDVGDAVGDAASWTGGQVVGVGKGFGEGVVGIGEGAWLLYRLSPNNAITRPGDFKNAWSDTGKAAEFAWDNPGEFGKQVANWEDLKEGRYGEWIGNLGPDAVLAVATGGTGTVVSRGTRTMRGLKALEEGADALDKANAAHRALTPTSKFGDKAVGAAGDDLSVSGWAKPKPDGYVDVPPERVRDFSDQIGHDLKPAKPSFLDGKRYPDGWDGKFNASHAEKQLGALHPGTHVGVDLDMCTDCQGFFSKYAQHTGQPQLVTDPSTTRVFMPDGKVIELSQPSDMPLDPFNSKAAIGAGAGSEGLSATQR
jgi:hypothetical protein